MNKTVCSQISINKTSNSNPAGKKRNSKGNLNCLRNTSFENLRDIVEIRRKFIAVNPYQEAFRSMIILARRGKKTNKLIPKLEKQGRKIT